jgi:hypothetical protein
MELFMVCDHHSGSLLCIAPIETVAKILCLSTSERQELNRLQPRRGHFTKHCQGWPYDVDVSRFSNALVG